MKKLAIVLLMTITASVNALTTKEYAQLFRNYDACFILYDVNKKKIVTEYNPNHRCQQRISPDSTFKIALSLMAFDQKIINQQTMIKWDGVNRDMPGWNQDQTPASWLKYSCVWVSQQITQQLGYSPIKHYLAMLHYGNQNFSGDPGKNNGLTYAWLGSSLKISAIEQLNFLISFVENKLPLSQSAIENTKKNLYLGKLENGADYFGKTGSGRHGRNERLSHPSLLRDGWFVGFIEDGQQKYIFVSNLTDKIPQAQIDKAGELKPYGSAVLKPITLQILNTYFST